MRRTKRNRPSLQAWFFALAVPSVALFMLFSLLPYQRMVGHWPLGIGQDEVMAYQAVFDHRPGQHAEGQVETYTLTGAGVGRATLRMQAGEAGAAVVPLAGQARSDGAFALDFGNETPFGGATALALVPADLQALHVLYAQAVADSLPIASPAIKVVLLQRDDRKAEPYLVQETITPAWVLQHAAVAMTLVQAEGRTEGQEAFRSMAVDSIGRYTVDDRFRADRFDTAATAALALLAQAEQRPALSQGVAGLLYDRVLGGLTPVYRMSYPGEAPPAEALGQAFRKALAAAPAQQGMVRWARRFQEDSSRWVARFLAIDSAAVPVLAEGRNLGLVQAEVDRARAAFMHRLFHPERLETTAPDPAATAPPLDPWLVQFRTDKDTLRFVRGKYNIDHDLVIPQGMAVVLEKGTRWFMAPGVSVVVNGELHMRGTDLNPVFIRPVDPAMPYGSIAVNGNGRTRVRINGLRISGGGNLWYQGQRHGGMLSFIGSDVRMHNSTIEESFGDASVSARRGTFRMGDCHFTGAHHGFIDLAEVQGAVERTAFLLPGVGAHATAERRALGLWSSHVLLRGCNFDQLPFTALDLARGGEAMVLASTFTGNGVAIKAVDGAGVQVDGCGFTGNKQVFVLRRNHPVLGGAVLKLYANNFADNGTERDADAASKVETGATLTPQAQQDFLAGKP